MNDGGLIRVIVEDANTKSQYKKAIYVTSNQSTREVIKMILEKSNISGSPSEYELFIPTSENGKKLLISFKRASSHI